MAEEQSKSPPSLSNEESGSEPTAVAESSVAGTDVKRVDADLSLPEVAEDKSSAATSGRSKVDEASKDDDDANRVESKGENSLAKDISPPEVGESADGKPEVVRKIVDESTKSDLTIVERDSTVKKVTIESLEPAGSSPEVKKDDSDAPAIEIESKPRGCEIPEKILEKSDKTADERKIEEDEDEDDDDEEPVDEEIEEAEEEEYRPSAEPEVGIVGPPTAVRDIVNEEELGTAESSSLPNETRNDEIVVGGSTVAASSRGPDVAEWIERHSSKPADAVKVTKRTVDKSAKSRKKSFTDVAASSIAPTRKSQRIITSIIRRSIKCLNKMHAAVDYGSGGTSGKKVETMEKREEDARGSPKVPQSRQNGAALPEETATAMATSGIAAERLCPVVKRENHSDAESEQQSMPIDCARPRRRSVDEVAAVAAAAAASRNSTKKTSVTAGRIPKTEREHTRKRRSTDDSFSSNCGNPFAKKICFEQRERFIDSLVGTGERVTAEELANRADELRAEVQALDELARAKEMEWNEILSMRKLKEEAYLRIERRRQVVGFMESNGQSSENLPPASLSLIPEWDSSTVVSAPRGSVVETSVTRDAKEAVEGRLLEAQDCQRVEESSRELSPVATRREKSQTVAVKSSNHAQRRTSSPKQVGENGRKQQQRQQQQQHQQQRQQQQQQQLQQQQHHHHHQQVEAQALENRQIGEGRQGPIVDVRSIIADYRLRHPETVPRRYDKKESRQREIANTTMTTGTTTTTGLINVRRGRRMRNSVNIGLGAGGAMVETGHNVDSRPSSTDSCKSNTNPSGDPNNSMSFKDVLVQFAKLSQQQGEPVKTPQNYPDVTLHPVAPSPIVQNSTSAQPTTGSLLHGILTKSQSPRPTTFSPTLARLLTAPERDRNSAPAATVTPQQNAQTQHLLQTYQGSNPVSISDLLSSSKARTEITITPVVNPVVPIHTSHGNNLVHVDDVEDDGAMIDDSRLNSGSRDNRDERDSPPRCQGCQERAAQFVCAGCGNQWYCSRDCQVAAWDEHSEVCSG